MSYEEILDDYLNNRIEHYGTLDANLALTIIQRRLAFFQSLTLPFTDKQSADRDQAFRLKDAVQTHLEACVYRNQLLDQSPFTTL